MTWPRRATLSRALLYLAVAAIVATTSGCWDKRELDESLHVLSAYIDLDPDGMIRVSVEVLALGARGAETAQTSSHAVLTGVGRSLQEAAWNLRWQAEAPLNFAHAGAIVIGEELARSGITDVLDSLAQGYEFRRRTLVAVSQGKAADLLSAALTASRHSEQIIELVQAAGTAALNGGSTTVNEVLRSLSSEGKNAVTARFILQPPPPVKHVAEHAQGGETEAGEGGGGEVGDSGGPHEEGPPVMVLNGAAIIGDDGKLAGFLEQGEADALQLVIGSAKSRIIRIPTDPAGLHKGFTLRTSSSSARYEAGVADGRLTLGVRVQVEADLLELNTGGDMATVADIAHLEQLAAQHLEALLLSGLTHCAGELGTDPAGFGRFMSRWHPQLWDQYRDRWPEGLVGAEMRPEVKVSIVNTGMLLRKALGPDQAPRPAAAGGN